jgi:transketolase
MRLEVLEMIYEAGFGHPGGSLSSVDILTTLYFGEFRNRPVLRYDPKKPQWEDQDYFILSKSHAAPALYAVLSEAGFFSKSELHHFRKTGGLLRAYPNIKIPGVIAPSASPGQGLSIACGIAFSLRFDKKSNRVYCLLGDGELQVGQVWEAALSASHHKLDNLCVIVDFNSMQAGGLVRESLNIDPIQDKFEAFGWKVFRTLEGNNVAALLDVFERAMSVKRKPTLIIADTIKGRGIPFMERKTAYHGMQLSKMEMEEARKVLERQLDILITSS